MVSVTWVYNSSKTKLPRTIRYNLPVACTFKNKLTAFLVNISSVPLCLSLTGPTVALHEFSLALTVCETRALFFVSS